MWVYGPSELMKALEPHVYFVSSSYEPIYASYAVFGKKQVGVDPASPSTLVKLTCVVKATTLAMAAKTKEAYQLALWAQVPVIVAAAMSAPGGKLVGCNAYTGHGGGLTVAIEVEA